MSNDTLRITEIFFSLQGETKTVGLPTVFIRLTGCPLRCHYCDSAYAFSGGKRMSIDEILDAIKHYATPYITVTGGEPLAQKACSTLLTRLCDEGYDVSLETSGALDIAIVDWRVNKVLDVKTPSSGEMDKNHWANFLYLTKRDQIKFVISDRNDYQWACDILQQYDLTKKCDVLFSPSYRVLDNKYLAEWLLEDALPVRFQLQMHKYIWGDIPGK